MISLSISSEPLGEAFAVRWFSLVEYFRAHGASHNFTRRRRMGGHDSLAVSPISALVTFLLLLPPPGIAHLLCPGELCRGLVEVVFFTPFHGGMITRKRKEIKA